ncbi:unnamed protein product [Durusdinium trenchii]|uniref:Uncharacterized protein n=1 Tax=Durusdinium trenchii TaxID=1381693 RepID=A0ABP0N5Z0_9DINO
MADVEKAKAREETGRKPNDLSMDDKVKIAIELNALREKWSEQFFQDNPKSVNFFGVTMDSNNMPAIQIGVDPAADEASLVIPEELRGVNLVFNKVRRAPQARPLRKVVCTESE